uniref:Growth differentiation factor 9 n=1 Tax=Maylandia zebra TaxID=106582 RepID=A0A3P9DF56_9CICH
IHTYTHTHTHTHTHKNTGRRSWRNWVEIDITSFFLPLLKFPKKNIHLLVNITCPEEQRAKGKGPLEITLRSPPLLLYLNDTSKIAHQWKRESPKSKRGDTKLDIQLPELLPSSEFPTRDCALYDFRVRFSQLKLDHWIVFPPKYNPRYCRGICPRITGFIYGSPKLDSSVPRPSCVPSHYSPLSVMIFEEDGSYVYKEFEDMVATRCTCR